MRVGRSAVSESGRKERVRRDSWVHLSCTQFRSSLQSGREGCRAAAASIWGSGLTFTSKGREKEEISEQEDWRDGILGVTGSGVNMNSSVILKKKVIYINIQLIDKSVQ